MSLGTQPHIRGKAAVPTTWWGPRFVAHSTGWPTRATGSPQMASMETADGWGSLGSPSACAQWAKGPWCRRLPDARDCCSRYEGSSDIGPAYHLDGTQCHAIVSGWYRHWGHNVTRRCTRVHASIPLGDGDSGSMAALLPAVSRSRENARDSWSLWADGTSACRWYVQIGQRCWKRWDLWKNWFHDRAHKVRRNDRRSFVANAFSGRRQLHNPAKTDSMSQPIRRWIWRTTLVEVGGERERPCHWKAATALTTTHGRPVHASSFHFWEWLLRCTDLTGYRRCALAPSMRLRVATTLDRRPWCSLANWDSVRGPPLPFFVSERFLRNEGLTRLASKPGVGRQKRIDDPKLWERSQIPLDLPESWEAS